MKRGITTTAPAEGRRPGAARVADLVLAIALAAGYLVLAQASLSLASIEGPIALVWPASGLAFAALVLLGPRFWPAVAAGALGSALLSAGVWPAALGEAAGNTLEPVIGALLLRRLDFHPELDRVRDVLLLLAAAAIASLASAAIGPAALRLGGTGADLSLPAAIGVWWLGDFLGVVVVAPAVFAFARTDLATIRARPLEAATLSAIFAGGCVALFTDVFSWEIQELPLSFLFWPLLVWSALRFGLAGGTATLLVLAVFATVGTAHGTGPFAFGSLVDRLVPLELFLAVHAFVTLFAAATGAERRAAIRLRDEFLAIASHELKTPLTPMKVDLQRLRAPGAPSPQLLERATRQLDRLTELIDGLLDVTRIGAGRLSLAPEAVDLVDVVRETSARLSPSTPGCRVELELPPEPLVGRWDRSRVEQVVGSLLSSGLRCPTPGRITVRLERRGSRAHLELHDPQAAEETRAAQRTLERFERGRPGEAAPGIGLGLFLGRRVAEALGGRLELRSDPAVGGILVLELPLEAAASPRARRRMGLAVR